MEEQQQPIRHELPSERRSVTLHFSIGDRCEGYLTVGLYEDGSPGEIFLVMAKEGSTISGLLDSFAIAVSLGLQYGVPLKLLVDKFKYTCFEPSGQTGNKDIPYAKSIMDYIFSWLSLKFLKPEDSRREIPSLTLPFPPTLEEEAPSCSVCGAITTRLGDQYKCMSCGTTHIMVDVDGPSFRKIQTDRGV